MRLEDILDIEGEYFIAGRGRIIAGTLKQSFDTTLLHLKIDWNNQAYEIVGVEALAVPKPYRKGAKVGLMLKLVLP